MNDTQSRKLNAAVAAQSIMDDAANQTIWNGQAAVASKKAEMDGSVIKIGKIDDKINDTTGNADAKSIAKEKAAKTAYIIGQALVAFAEDNDDDVLLGEIDFPFSELRNKKDQTVIDRWQLIHDRANANAPALDTGGYGVNPPMIAQFQLAIDDFKNKKGKPKAAKANTKALNEELKDEFKELDKITDSLQTRLVQFAEANGEFYHTVINAFAIDDIGVRHNAIRLVYVDAVTGVRLRGVNAKLVEKALEKFSSKRGVSTFTQQETPEGNYTVDSSLPGYTNVRSANIGVQAGKVIKMVVQMVKQ